jgi:transposase
MMVIGVDPHKSTHTAAAVDRAPGHARLLDWARALDAQRVWAIEDCRHVSGGLERFLVERGERVVRVAPKHMAGARSAQRERGKSDPIDALAVARAALREGVEALPGAHLDERALEIKLLLDHREDLVAERTRIQNRLRWHLHELWPEFEIAVAALDRLKWLDRVGRRLVRSEPTARVRVCRDQLRRLRELARSCTELERELTPLVAAKAPQLLELPGCGPLSAAKLIAETAGAERFDSDAKFARLAGIAPIPAASGRRDRHRLDRRGNRQLNCAVHRIAVSQGRLHQPARDYLARKQSEGKSRREALRCLKRHLARRIWHLLQMPAELSPTSIPQFAGST